MQISFYILIL